MISVIMPVWNEERALSSTLNSLCAQVGDFEVIAVDGGSSDSTLAILAEYPSVHVLHSRRGRGTQMNAGARSARGEILLFLHADTLLPKDAIQTLEEIEREGKIPAGCFRQSFSNADWRLKIVSWLHNWRCSVTGIIYGDQAMFVHRTLFFELGSFPEALMEDIHFSKKLLKLAQPKILSHTVVTDARKFVQMGVWKSLGRIVLILLCLNLKLPPPKTFFADVR